MDAVQASDVPGQKAHLDRTVEQCDQPVLVGVDQDGHDIGLRGVGIAHGQEHCRGGGVAEQV